MSVSMLHEINPMINVNAEFEEVTSIFECAIHIHDCDAYIFCDDYIICFFRIKAQSNCLSEFDERNELLNA